jgi:hypothetical protein
MFLMPDNFSGWLALKKNFAFSGSDMKRFFPVLRVSFLASQTKTLFVKFHS